MSSSEPVPSGPCPWCGGQSFLRLRDAFVEVASAGCSEPEHTPRFTLVVCEGCGRTEWFTSPQRAAAYWTRLGAPLDRIEARPPYR